ncbi:hypothetical protein, partial [Escherichia coli]
KGWAILLRQKQKKLIMLPSETMIWQPEFTDKTLSRKPGAVQYQFLSSLCLLFNQIGVITDAMRAFPRPDSHSDRPFVSCLDLSVAGSAFMRGVSSPIRVTQEGPDGLSRYCPVRVICLEIQLCFLTGALLWPVKLRKNDLTHQ